MTCIIAREPETVVLGDNFPHLDYSLSLARLQEEPFSKSLFLDQKHLDGNSEEKKKKYLWPSS